MITFLRRLLFLTGILAAAEPFRPIIGSIRLDGTTAWMTIAAAGVEVVFLPAYSPEFNRLPMETQSRFERGSLAFDIRPSFRGSVRSKRFMIHDPGLPRE